jgi:hypothetical protein
MIMSALTLQNDHSFNVTFQVIQPRGASHGRTSVIATIASSKGAIASIPRPSQ